MQSDGRMGRRTERRGGTAWDEKYAEAGCQNVREWGHRVYCKVDGAGSLSEDDG